MWHHIQKIQYCFQTGSSRLTSRPLITWVEPFQSSRCLSTAPWEEEMTEKKLRPASRVEFVFTGLQAMTGASHCRALNTFIKLMGLNISHLLEYGDLRRFGVFDCRSECCWGWLVASTKVNNPLNLRVSFKVQYHILGTGIQLCAVTNMGNQDNRFPWRFPQVSVTFC